MKHKNNKKDSLRARLMADRVQHGKADKNTTRYIYNTVKEAVEINEYFDDKMKKKVAEDLLIKGYAEVFVPKDVVKDGKAVLCRR